MLIISFIIFLFYGIYFYYQFKWGYLSEYNLVKKINLTDSQQKEKSIYYELSFFEDHGYIGSNKENRMFYYKDIEFIQQLENIVIIYFYLKKDKHLTNFSEFVIDLKEVSEETQQLFLQFVKILKMQYKIESLSNLNKLV